MLFLPSHVMDNMDKIEEHAKHRPRHYKEDISPLIYGLFSRSFPFNMPTVPNRLKLISYPPGPHFIPRECREAFAKYLRNLLTPWFPLPPQRCLQSTVECTVCSVQWSV